MLLVVKIKARISVIILLFYSSLRINASYSFFYSLHKKNQSVD